MLTSSLYHFRNHFYSLKLSNCCKNSYRDMYIKRSVFSYFFRFDSSTFNRFFEYILAIGARHIIVTKVFPIIFFIIVPSIDCFSVICVSLFCVSCFSTIRSSLLCLYHSCSVDIMQSIVLIRIIIVILRNVGYGVLYKVKIMLY